MIVTWTGRELEVFLNSILDRRETRRPAEDRLIDVDEAAKLLAVSKEFLYHNAQKLPFTRKLGRGLLRFSANGIQKFIESKKSI